ncbi:MAG: hypothetical protein ACXWYS_02770 [Gaiellaceae bacterium]
MRSAAVIATLAALAFVPSSAARPAATCCGAVTVKGARYAIRIERGAPGCVAARTALRAFIATAASPKGWTCFRGHGTQKWAAACARNHAIVRAYIRTEP